MTIIVRLALTSMTVLALHADAHAGGTKGSALAAFNLQKAQAPNAAYQETTPTMTYEATLIAVFPSSVVIRRSIDPVVLKRGIASGRIAIGTRSLASIETMVAVEGLVVFRLGGSAIRHVGYGRSCGLPRLLGIAFYDNTFMIKLLSYVFPNRINSRAS